MAVLIEAISVVVCRVAIDERFSGGWTAFFAAIPNRTMFGDGDLTVVSFMSPDDAESYIFYLESAGLDFNVGGTTGDIAVVDQVRGPTIPSPWLEFGEVDKDGNKVKACWLAGQEPGDVFAHRGWHYDGSLSQKPGFVPAEDVDKSVKFLRREGGLEVYLDIETGKEVYLGRSEIPGETKQTIFERLSAICTEAVELDLEMQTIRESGDEERGAAIYLRLQGDLLVTAESIISGPGRNMAFAHFVRGLVLRVLNRQAEAEPCFRHSHKIQPGVPNTLLELVRCLGELGKYDEALPFAREAVMISPDDPATAGNLAMCLIQNGERDEARKAIDRAIELDPENRINRYIYENFERYF